MAPSVRVPGEEVSQPGRVAPPIFDVVGIGASAGGFNSLCWVLEVLPASFPCGVLVVQHLSPNHKSVLAELLERKTALQVRQAREGEPVVGGVVYVGPPGAHMVVKDNCLRLLSSPELHFHRPSIDLMFESVANNYGARAIAVVLSGSGTDGAMGLTKVKHAGGTTLSEDPKLAKFNAMPQAAVATGCVDMILPLGKIGSAIVELCSAAIR